jgi:hypothetical protein
MFSSLGSFTEMVVKLTERRGGQPLCAESADSFARIEKNVCVDLGERFFENLFVPVAGSDWLGVYMIDRLNDCAA